MLKAGVFFQKVQVPYTWVTSPVH